MTEESPRHKMATGKDAPATDEMDEIVEMKDNVLYGPISSRDFEGKNSTSACT